MMTDENTQQPQQEEEQTVAEKAQGADSRADEVGDGEKHVKPALRREPSFSGWCDEDGILRLRPSAAADDGSPGTCSAADESEDFELPLLSATEVESLSRLHEFRQRSMFMGNTNGDATKYVPLDVESSFHASDSISKVDRLDQSTQSPISTALVFKTLFYILIWYTFSTCLTV